MHLAVICPAVTLRCIEVLREIIYSFYSELNRQIRMKRKPACTIVCIFSARTLKAAMYDFCLSESFRFLL